MSVRFLRSRVRVLIRSAGFVWAGEQQNDDRFHDPGTRHNLIVTPWPRWGRRIDGLTVTSAFPLPSGPIAPAFRLDLASQVREDGASVPAGWRPQEVEGLVEASVLPYLRQGRDPSALLDLLLDGEIRPPGSARARTVVEHGFYLALWWQLHDRIDALREIATLVPADQRSAMERAPWGRTALAEVMWHGRELPALPARAPWGLADQGDAQSDVWLHGISGGGPLPAGVRGPTRRLVDAAAATEPEAEPEGLLPSTA